LLGACGYMSSTITLNDKKYRLFHWSGFYAAKWGYRFAKKMDKKKKFNILARNADGDVRYRKIRCPPVLHQYLLKSFEDDKAYEAKQTFVKQHGHLFITEQELNQKLENGGHFFPFKNLAYNQEIAKKMFEMFDDAAHQDLDWQSLDLHLTRKAKNNISSLYTWIRQGYAKETIAVGRLATLI